MSRTFGNPYLSGAQFTERLIRRVDDHGMSVDRRMGIEFHKVRLQHDLLAADVEFVRGHHPIDDVINIHRVGLGAGDQDIGDQRLRHGSGAARTRVPSQGDTRCRSDTGRKNFPSCEPGLAHFDLQLRSGLCAADASAVSASSSVVRGVG